MNTTEKYVVTTRDPEYDKAFWNVMEGGAVKYDDLAMGTNGTGGFILPDHASMRFSDAIKKESIFRKISTVIYNYGDAKIHTDGNDGIATFVAEGDEIPTVDVMDTHNTIRIERHKLATSMRFPTAFAKSPAFNLEKNLVKQMAKMCARGEEKAFITGTGINEPTGILCPNDGASVGVTANTITYDDVVKLYFSVKPEYRKNGKWIMNDETALALRTLKDKDGNYIWNQAFDTILGKEVIISEHMPNAVADTAPIAFGDFSYYWIVDRDRFSVKVLSELFAETDHIGYIGFEFVDGKLINKDAMKLLYIQA